MIRLIHKAMCSQVEKNDYWLITDTPQPAGLSSKCGLLGLLNEIFYDNDMGEK
jgi:hypothetical protein